MGRSGEPGATNAHRQVDRVSVSRADNESAGSLEFGPVRTVISIECRARQMPSRIQDSGVLEFKNSERPSSGISASLFAGGGEETHIGSAETRWVARISLLFELDLLALSQIFELSADDRRSMKEEIPAAL